MAQTGRPKGATPFPSLAVILKGAVLAAPLFFAGAASAMQQGPQIPEHFQKTAFDHVEGWKQDNQLAALKGFLRFCKRSHIMDGGPELLRATSDELRLLCEVARGKALETDSSARHFFETHFTPFRINEKGFVTGYFEPEVAASRKKTEDYSVPLHKKPAGLEAATATNRPIDWPSHLSHGRRVNGTLQELPDRGAIMDGALDKENLELVWLADPVDAFFIHVQGSARLRLTDGSTMRVGYAGKTGHPYTGIGRLLVKRGEGSPEDFTMSGLRAWLTKNHEKRDALFKENRSYIFFREVHEAKPDDGPIGAANHSLVAGRSLAVDPSHFPYGALIFVSAGFRDPDVAERSFARLMVSDDTGSAIRGPARGDIFTGSGVHAGQIAGDIRHQAEFVVLVPNSRLANAGAAVD